MGDCVFCRNIPRVIENDLAYAVFDINPVSKGHALVISKRHVAQYFDLVPDELAAMQRLLFRLKDLVQKEHSPDGYNIWVNCGAVAGQAVMHAHIHLIPRYDGQVLHIREHLKGNIA